MTEPGELDLMSLCERAGRVIGPCLHEVEPTEDERKGMTLGDFLRSRCLTTCICAGTGVEPDTLRVLYKLATDVADMVEAEEREAISNVLHVESVYKNGENN